MARAVGTSVTVPGNPTQALELTPKQYVDARVADAVNITTGTLDNARLPKTLSGVRTVNPSGGTISIDANTAGNNINSTGSSATTLNVPTNGGDAQVLQLAIYASTGFTLTFHASFGRLTGIASTLVIATGKVARVALRRTDVTGSAKWLVESVGVEQ